MNRRPKGTSTVTMSKAEADALDALTDACEAWAKSESARENTPEEERILAALRALGR